MKLWAGRFAKETDNLVNDFHSSISFDQRLFREDIAGSLAHAAMLRRIGVLSEEEERLLCQGLEEILLDITEGRVTWADEAEDIHMNIEKLLTERIGDIGKKLHTGRSRNDQVALDLRLYLRREIDTIAGLLLVLTNSMLTLAERHTLTWMPGYTHLQKAQPVSFGHHLVAYTQMFSRDLDRLADTRRRLNVSPLGSGALAGTPYALDRAGVAEELGFAGVTLNSMDGVSDRDFAVEFIAAASLLMMHLSRLSEEIILWSTNEFGFITLDDAYATGSSIMPQKKNPDVAELVRGKTGRVYGNLVGLLTVMKGLPLAYNKDMQEDKESVFDTVDTLKKCLLVMSPMLETMTVNKEAMNQGARQGYTNATDLADYLVGKGIPFRNAHEIIGKLVLVCDQENRLLENLTLEELRQASPVFDWDIYEQISVEACVRKRNHVGGTGPEQVSRSIESTRMILEKMSKCFTGVNESC
ncbi:MAG: argininosuccinate lyase [Peptococcaceae bacterium]|nr:argininosuccinate lyase [Peptococcaceae bacterium]